jgi:S-adenosylmethionine:tRNA ribosyltransferase-isomerase
LVGNSKKWKEDSLNKEIQAGGLTIQLQATRSGQNGRLQGIRFDWQCAQRTLHFSEVLELAGIIPIPPYLKRESENSDEKDYQTVYSKIKGSVAAPTAGLHFSEEELRNLDQQHILRRELTLHVSASTFQPVKSACLQEHPMHLEFFTVERKLIEEIIQNNNPLIAVGTTSVRTLESLYWLGLQLIEHKTSASDELVVDQWFPYLDHHNYSTKESLTAVLDYLDRSKQDRFCASTRLLIAPGYRFRLVNAMLTNFHQPNSTLLLLVAAFTGDAWRDIYDHALSSGYRFLSYGDSMLLRPGGG